MAMLQNNKPRHLLLPALLILNNSSTKSAWLGLNICDNGALIPVINLAHDITGHISMDAANWKDLQKRFTTVATYLNNNNNTEEEEATVSTTTKDDNSSSSNVPSVMIGNGFMLEYEVYKDQPAVIIQSTQYCDTAAVQRFEPFYRFTKEDFTQVTMLQNYIDTYMSWLSRVHSDVEMCKITLIVAISSYATRFTVSSLLRTIRRKRQKIQEFARQQLKAMGPSYELTAPSKNIIIDELLTHHLGLIVNSVIKHNI